MAKDHALKMQLINNIYLFTASCNIHLKKGTGGNKSKRGKGVLLSRLQNIAEATPPTRNRKEKKKLTTQVRCEQ